MGRPERPLDPEAGPVERLAWDLRRLRDEAAARRRVRRRLRPPDGRGRTGRAAPVPVVLSGFGGTVVRPAFAPGGGRLVTPLGSVSVLANGTWRPTGLAGRFVRTWDCEVCGPGSDVLRLAKRRAVRGLTAEERRIHPGSWPSTDGAPRASGA